MLRDAFTVLVGLLLVMIAAALNSLADDVPPEMAR